MFYFGRSWLEGIDAQSDIPRGIKNINYWGFSLSGPAIGKSCRTAAAIKVWPVDRPIYDSFHLLSFGLDIRLLPLLRSDSFARDSFKIISAESGQRSQ